MKMTSIFRCIFLCVLFVFFINLKLVKSDYPTHLPPYDTFFFEQKLDHLNYLSTDTFQQRYLLSFEYYDHTTSSDVPLFVYTGNEGDILSFYNNTGMIFKLASKFNGLVLFTEHRFYGESIPASRELSTLSVEMCIYDFIKIIQFVKQKYKNLSKTILIGGSYGGMIASYMKIKYPNLIDGVLASSSPNLHFEGITDPFEFSKIISKCFTKTVENCDDFIRRGFKLMDKMVIEKKYNELSQSFHTCETIKSEKQGRKLISIVEGVVEMLACVNYPSSSSFSKSLPPYPVKVACNKIMNESLLQNGMFEILNVFYNYSGKVQCMDVFHWHKPILQDKFWRFQRCTEFVLPIANNGVSDFFLPKKWDLKEFEKECKDEFGENLSPQPYFIPLIYHGIKIKDPISNIIFSNGEEDPWASGGVYEKNIDKNAKEVYSIVMKDSAHHQDLRFPSEGDSKSIIDGREREIEIISKWLELH